MTSLANARHNMAQVAVSPSWFRLAGSLVHGTPTGPVRVSISAADEYKNPANTTLFLGTTQQLVANVTPFAATRDSQEARGRGEGGCGEGGGGKEEGASGGKEGGRLRTHTRGYRGAPGGGASENPVVPQAEEEDRCLLLDLLREVHGRRLGASAHLLYGLCQLERAELE